MANRDAAGAEVPNLNFQVGLGYKPPAFLNVHFYTGSVYEFWWQVGTNSNLECTANSNFAFFDNQGLGLQAIVDF